MYAAFGIMNALRVKDKTGKGQYVDVSMLEGQLGLLQGTIGAYLADGELPQPMGTAYKALLPYQTFRTRTRDLALAVGSERLWRIFCPLMGLADMLDDPRYANNAGEMSIATLIARLQDLHNPALREWEALFLQRGIPVAPLIPSIKLSASPVKARGALVECEHPVAGKVKIVGVPVKLSETPGRVRQPAPLLGQHTDEVLRQYLGLNEAEITALRQAGALGTKRAY
jgi:formyl-CoA transferase/CoA:oxalate CoA-transferase